MADLQRRFVDGAVLILPLEQINIQYDPNSMIPFGDAGTVYPTLFLSDAWGRITVSNGALLSSDWTTLRVAAPVDLEARPLKGDGYDLELSDVWEIATGQRMGDYILRQK